MSAPNVLRLVVDHALAEAVERETKAAEMEVQAQQLRSEASVLRSLYEVAEPHVPKRAQFIREVA